MEVTIATPAKTAIPLFAASGIETFPLKSKNITQTLRAVARRPVAVPRADETITARIKKTIGARPSNKKAAPKVRIVAAKTDTKATKWNQGSLVESHAVIDFHELQLNIANC